jgi:hypothetical protein
VQKCPLGLTIIAWIALADGVLAIASGLVVIAVGFYLPGVAVDGGLGELPPRDRDAAGLLSDPEFAELMVRAGVYSVIVSAAFAKEMTLKTPLTAEGLLKRPYRI